MSNKTIYQYIIENFDPENENFTQPTLIDEPNPSVPHPLGAEDAFWFSSNAPVHKKGADNVFAALQDYLQYPDHVHKQKLYKTVISEPIIALAEPFCDKMQTEEIDDAMLALARSFFYNGQHRGAIKFAYILFGLYGVEKIKAANEELWADMVNIAKCEEFTYFFIFACTLSNYTPHKAIWRLIGCTEGWGRVFATEAAICEDEAQELWLIQHGMEINVDYPPLAAHILEISSLPKHLEEEEISYRTFKGAAVILNTFLVLLDHYDESVLEANLNTAVIRPVQLLQNFLKHAKVHATKPEDILQVLNLSYGLRNLEQNKGLCIIGDNDLHFLIATCDSIIYAQDWHHYVENNLINGDSINYELCDFACEMDMDIWKLLFDFICTHPLEIKALPYLFSFNDENYRNSILHFVEFHLPLYRMEESALLVPLKYLEHHPGEGEQIIITALTSLYDWPRGIACAVLNSWGQEYLSGPIKNALREGLKLSNNDVVTARIKSLLLDKTFSIDELIND